MTEDKAPTDEPAKLPRPIPVWPFVLILVVLSVVSYLTPKSKPGDLELERRSDYSHIRIRKKGSVRTLIFVRDTGKEVVESRMNMERPHELQLPYSQAMFASHLFVPQPKRVLIVGLGAGSMVRFLQHHQPELKIDAVDIDPVVVEIAETYFATRSSGGTNIVIADAFVFLKETKHKYDVIYMDAFLKPAADTDQSGVPQRLKTIEFFRSIQTKLTPQGLVVFNLNINDDTPKDIATIEQAFATTSVFTCASKNLAVVALREEVDVSEAQLLRTAKELDARFKANFSFEVLLDQRRD